MAMVGQDTHPPPRPRQPPGSVLTFLEIPKCLGGDEKGWIEMALGRASGSGGQEGTGEGSLRGWGPALASGGELAQERHPAGVEAGGSATLPGARLFPAPPRTTSTAQGRWLSGREVLKGVVPLVPKPIPGTPCEPGHKGRSQPSCS